MQAANNILFAQAYHRVYNADTTRYAIITPKVGYPLKELFQKAARFIQFLYMHEHLP